MNSIGPPSFVHGREMKARGMLPKVHAVQRIYRIVYPRAGVEALSHRAQRFTAIAEETVTWDE